MEIKQLDMCCLPSQGLELQSSEDASRFYQEMFFQDLADLIEVRESGWAVWERDRNLAEAPTGVALLC